MNDLSANSTSLADAFGSTAAAWSGRSPDRACGGDPDLVYDAGERDRLWLASRDLLGVTDAAGSFRSVNPAWTEVLGWSERELRGMLWAELVHPDDAAAAVLELGRLLRGARTRRHENRVRARDGAHRWISWSATPEGGKLYWVGRDVTAERAVADELDLMQDALRQAQEMEAVGQLTGGIAHAFNNLLTGVIGSLDTLQRRVAQGRTLGLERHVATAMTSATRAAALTQRLLAFSRRQALSPCPVDAHRLVTGMEELLRRSVGKAVELRAVTAVGLWQACCDPRQLENAILNLAANARDAMPGGGALTVETCNAELDANCPRDVVRGQYVCIAVADTGTGMSAEVAARAFDPFFTTKPIGQGTGLGLSMVYGFARQSGGYARIESEPGRGTTVRLYLPRHPGCAEAAVIAAGAGERRRLLDPDR